MSNGNLIRKALREDVYRNVLSKDYVKAANVFWTNESLFYNNAYCPKGRLNGIARHNVFMREGAVQICAQCSALEMSEYSARFY